MKKNILIFAVVLCGGAFLSWGLLNVSNAKTANILQAQKKPTIDQRVAVLEKNVANLQKAVDSLSKQLQATAKKQQALSSQTASAQSSDALPKLVSSASPSVVSVVISKDVPLLELVYTNPFKDDPAFQGINIQVPTYKQKGTEKQKVGAGTGFIVTSDGYIITNKHVVADDTATYTVLLPDGSKQDAKVFYRDPTDDIAIIKISGKYKSLPLGNSDTLQVGQTVVAIGNALGQFDNTISTGIISGLNRSINASDGANNTLETLSGIIQTTAAINPGNSGGPLLDLTGHVIGVDVATVIGSQNIGFALPINRIRDVISLALGR